MLTQALVFLSLLVFSAPSPAQVAGVAPGSTPPPSQQSTQTPTPTPGSSRPKRQAPHPLADQAPGGGPDKVWVNLSSAKYHCFGDRYYGRTSSGRYMTQAAAKAAGARGPRGKDCPATPR